MQAVPGMPTLPIPKNPRPIGLPCSLFLPVQSFYQNFRFERQVIYGKAEHKGSAMVPSEREFVSSYRLSVVTFPLHECDVHPLICHG